MAQRVVRKRQTTNNQSNTNIQNNQPIVEKPSTQVAVGYSSRWAYLIVFLLAFGLYANTIKHDYALDDVVVITSNDFTKQGIAGLPDIFSYDTFTGYLGKQKKLVVGGRYRPLSVASFAIENEFFAHEEKNAKGEPYIKSNPHVSHFINVLLFACLAVLIYSVLSKLLVQYSQGKWWLSLAFWTTILYVAHPIHTEAVANIKGRDEILVMLFSLLAMYSSLKFLQTRRFWWLAVSFVVFFLGYLSKENTITFVAVIPLTLYFFTNYTNITSNIATERRAAYTNLVMVVTPLLMATFIFLTMRHYILGGAVTEVIPNLINDAFLYADTSQRYGTVFYTWFIYVKLLVFPHPLTVDYYPYHIPLVPLTDFRAFLPLLFFVGVAVWSLWLLRRRSVVSYSILFYFITFSLVSNLLFSIGTFMNERFIFISSLGFSLLFAYGLYQLAVWLKNRSQKLAQWLPIAVLSVVTCLYAAKTIDRNQDWLSDFTLFSIDAKTSEGSAFSPKALGTHMLNRGMEATDSTERTKLLADAIVWLTKAVEVYPEYDNALFLLGNATYQHNKKDYRQAIEWYKKVLKLQPDHDDVFKNVPLIIAELPNPAEQLQIYTELYELSKHRYEVLSNMAALYLIHFKDYKKAIDFLNKTLLAQPNDLWAMKNLGVAYYNNGEFAEARKCFEKAAIAAPNDPQIPEYIKAVNTAENKK